MLGFKAFHSAAATIAGIEVAHMIRKKQFANDNSLPFMVFAELAAQPPRWSSSLCKSRKGPE
jgi:putative transposase